jgi:hypothetical protein
VADLRGGGIAPSEKSVFSRQLWGFGVRVADLACGTTCNLGPKVAPFLVKPDDQDYITEIRSFGL